MRILIIGEYSGLAKHLKNGFTALGHKVTIVSAGDGFKKIKSGPDDINYEIKSLKLLGRHLPKSHLIFAVNKNRKLQKQLNLISEKIDIVLVVNFNFLTNSLFKVGVKVDYLNELLSNKAKLIMLCCGGDPALRNNHFKGHLKYNIEKFPDGISKNALKRDLRFDFLIKYSDLIIPTSYEYFDSIKRYTLNTPANNKISNVIPIPIKIDNYSFNSCIGRKIVVFHGVIREQIKGTKFFLKALKKVSQIRLKL